MCDATTQRGRGGRRGLRLSRSALVVLVVAADPAEVAGNWDGDRLRQVLNNLVGNAIKYAPGGQITILLRQESD